MWCVVLFYFHVEIRFCIRSRSDKREKKDAATEKEKTDETEGGESKTSSKRGSTRKERNSVKKERGSAAPTPKTQHGGKEGNDEVEEKFQKPK